MHALKLHGSLRVSTLIALVAAGVTSCFSPQRQPGVAVYASGTDLESGNPLVTVHSLSRQIQRYALFVTLAKYDSALAPEPYAARRWEWSPDRRTLVLHLAPDLMWHDGQPTTARDVAFTIDAARDPVTGFWRATDLASVDSVIAVDDSTARVVFNAPQPELPLIFCELPILPAHLLARTAHADMKRAAFNLRPVGNGPFEFVERRAGERWVFRRNPRFPIGLGGPPTLSGFVVSVVDEPTTKFAGLASGDLDVAGIAPTMAALAARDRSLRVLDYPILFTSGLVFNVHKPPFDDVRVRRAISASIDRDRIVRAALAGYGRPAAGPVPPESPLALEGAPVHDTLLADSLFDAAGWHRGADGVRQRGGRRFELDLITVGSGDNALEQLVQADLAARGVRANIRQVELGTFLTQARAAHKSFDVLVAGVPGDVSLAFLAALFESRQAGGALDYSGYHSPRLDSAFAATRSARTDAERVAAWRTVQRIFEEEMPVAWVYHSRGVQGLSRRLHNVVMDLRGEMVTLARWQLAQ
ncbi:MAG: ABC-type transporter, periplasmic subunit [Gemmatimonadetes bacterium]|nr:ABC-type transporter, periplasmic subunit [Gemmatimonadota bacterium]